MNCYVGLAKRIAKSFFPPVIPVPQLEPLDARNIIKQEVKNISTTKECFALSEVREFKPISDEEAWEAALVWAEAKAQEREVLATKEESQTNTDESYDSDDSEFGVSIQPVSRVSNLFGPDTDEDDFKDEETFVRRRSNIVAWERGREVFSWAAWVDAENLERRAKNRYTAWVVDVMIGVRTKAAAARVVEEKRAARIIQTAARGRAVRAWNPFVSVPTISQTDTDESYDSDDFLVVAMAGLMRVGEVVRAKVYNLNDAAAAAAMWRDDAQAEAYEFVAAAKAVKKFWANVDAANAAKSQAATIIQATERGRVARMVVLIVADATEVLQLSKFVTEDWTGIAVARAVVAMGVMGLMKTRAVGLVNAVVEWHAATIIQATARGRAVRIAAWDAAFDKVVAERAKRRHTAKETRRAWKAAFDPTTWYRV
jgi:hypothetical protein